MTSLSSRQAGNTSTKRNSWVLNPGWAMAHSSSCSLHQVPRKMRDFSESPASAMRRASAWTSASEGAAIPLEATAGASPFR